MLLALRSGQHVLELACGCQYDERCVSRVDVADQTGGPERVRRRLQQLPADEGLAEGDPLGGEETEAAVALTLIRWGALFQLVTDHRHGLPGPRSTQYFQRLRPPVSIWVRT